MEANCYKTAAGEEMQANCYNNTAADAAPTSASNIIVTCALNLTISPAIGGDDQN